MVYQFPGRTWENLGDNFPEFPPRVICSTRCWPPRNWWCCFRHPSMAGTSGILHSLPHWTIIWSDCRLKLVQERPNVILEIKVGNKVVIFPLVWHCEKGLKRATFCAQKCEKRKPKYTSRVPKSTLSLSHYARRKHLLWLRPRSYLLLCNVK